MPIGTAVSTSAIDLSWAAAADADSSTLTYQVFRDGGSQPVGSVSGGTTGTIAFRDTGLAAGTSHAYTVRAVDPDGNVGPMSSGPAAVWTFVFTDGFDAGLGQWPDRSKTATLDSATAPPGGAAPSLRLTAKNAAAYARHALGTTYGSICTAAWVDATSVSKKPVTLIAFRNASNKAIGRLQVDPTGALSVRSDVAGTTRATSGVLPLGTWGRVDVCVTTGATGSWSVWLNGTSVLQAWSANNGTSAVGTVQLGDESVKTFTINGDDVVVHR